MNTVEHANPIDVEPVEVLVPQQVAFAGAQGGEGTLERNLEMAAIELLEPQQLLILDRQHSIGELVRLAQPLPRTLAELSVGVPCR